MAYKIIIQPALKDKFDKLEHTNYKEYKMLSKKLEEMATHATIPLNHRKLFNEFEKPLLGYKWIEINDKILIFKLDQSKEVIHLYDYMPQKDIFRFKP
ncbi:MAG: hypothetical protein Q4Q23_03785 [Methanobacteriaceae archaeon]|nr:hypothetical protein [Methanobacteriaceae archaeon]